MTCCNLTSDSLHASLEYTLCRLPLKHELWLKPGGAAGTLRQSALIFLLRTVTFEAISSGVAHKECHGGKVNHSPDPRPPDSPRLTPTSPAPDCLGHVAIGGLQKLISENVRILPGAGLGSARPLHAINSSPLSQVHH